MAKKSFWQGVKDFFKDEPAHIITDEEWEAMQAEETAAAAADDTPLEQIDTWRCPECRHANEKHLVFCERCGYYPGDFADILSKMTDEHIQIVLRGSIRYPASQLRLLEDELTRRKKGIPFPGPASEKAAAAGTAADSADVGWICSRCKTQNPQEEYFCTNCGEYRF